MLNLTWFDLQNNYYKIKKIFRHYNRSGATRYEKQKKKYLINKECNKFAEQFDFTPKGIGIKEKAI